MSIESYKNLSIDACAHAERMAAHAKAMYGRCQQIAKAPSRFGTACLALTAGAQQLYNGNAFFGTASLALGAREIWNLTALAQTDDLSNQLNDIEADIGVIEALEKANQKSFADVNQNLLQIQDNVTAIENQLSAIGKINAAGNQAVEKKKAHAEQLNRESIGYFETAQKHCRSSMTLLEKLKQNHGLVESAFQKSKEIIENKGSIEEKTQQLMQIAQEASKTCNEGQHLLSQMMEEWQNSMEFFHKGKEKKDAAFAAAAEAVQVAQAVFKTTHEKVEVNGDCQQKILHAQEELKKVEQRSAQIVQVIEEMKEELERAQKCAASKLDTSDLLIATAITASAPVGAAYAVLAGVAATYAWRNKTTIAKASRSVYHFFSGMQEKAPKPMGREQMLSVEFDETSSGYLGYAMGRKSQTVGRVRIALDHGEEIAIRFNADERNKISKLDVLNLYQLLNKKVQDGSLSPKRCLALLDQLQDIRVDRGKEKGVFKGFIKETDTTFCILSMLKELCHSRTKNLSLTGSLAY